MKKLFYSIIILLLSTTVFAQAPQSFKYQAVVRDVSGEIIADQQVSFQISILQSSASGTAVYTETHVDSTNQFGLVTLEIGTGTTTDDFSGIDWSKDAYFIQIEMDASGGTSYTLMGTSQLLSVPYALHAKTATNTFSGNYSDLTNKPLIPDTLKTLVTDAGNKNITNLADPTYAQDAATKAYVDALEQQIVTIQNTLLAGGYVQDYDGNMYNTVTIGNQVWMAENLKTTKYNDGTAIPLVTDSTAWSNLSTPGYCWYNNNEATYKDAYGALYNWYTIETGNLCSTGWHVPTDNEWKELEMYLGMSQADVDNQGWRGINEGSKLAGNKNLWQDGILENDAEFGTSGFTALPGGLRYHYSSFRVIGNKGELWSATEYNTDRAWYRSLRCYYSSVYRFYYYKECGFSVRCVRDD